MLRRAALLVATTATVALGGDTRPNILFIMVSHPWLTTSHARVSSRQGAGWHCARQPAPGSETGDWFAPPAADTGLQSDDQDGNDKQDWADLMPKLKEHFQLGGTRFNAHVADAPQCGCDLGALFSHFPLTFSIEHPDSLN